MVGLFLVACLSMPWFDDGRGQDCPVARQEIECTCSECIEFDWPTGATRMEVNRRTVSSGASIYVGNLERVQNNDPDDPVSWFYPRFWCPVKGDAAMPQENVLYEYAFRGCNAAGCGDWGTLRVRYRAAPYACFRGGKEVQCYLGAPLRLPRY